MKLKHGQYLLEYFSYWTCINFSLIYCFIGWSVSRCTFSDPLVTGSLLHWLIGSLNSLMHWFTESLFHWIIDSLLIDSLNFWFIGSLNHWFTHRFTGSLVGWFIESLLRCLIDSWIHWSIGSLVHSFSCARILSCHVIGTSQLQPLTASASQKYSSRPLISYSHFPCLKLPPWRGPGTIWYI